MAVIMMAQDIVVAVAVTVSTLVSTSAPGPFDQLLRGGDEGVGPPQVVAQDVEQAVDVGAGPSG